ncbi:hypothetical protein DRF57_18500 [Chryseobacterium rhizosphaerae]|uniref:Uncharacterized protein n=1 Tax=Chryseobacterium rhizosphaerae TaxID=395937 RepID=A0ABX9IGD0_9FLAO|nr:hypothetical protein DRF57_18500 [Chryseobacterium rhizosphaerae]
MRRVASGNEKSINYLGTALRLGSIFIMPSFVYLIYGFSKNKFWQQNFLLLNNRMKQNTK